MKLKELIEILNRDYKEYHDCDVQYIYFKNGEYIRKDFATFGGSDNGVSKEFHFTLTEKILEDK